MLMLMLILLLRYERSIAITIAIAIAIDGVDVVVPLNYLIFLGRICTQLARLGCAIGGGSC